MKYFILSCFLAFLNFGLTAQTWIESGAKWHYDYWNIGEGGFYKLEYVQDSIIDGISCQMIEAVRFSFGLSSPGGPIVQIGQDTLGANFTYLSGDTVFYRNNGEFFVLHNFGAAIGDSWVISTSNPGGPWSNCNDTSRIEVTDTGTVTINSTLYRYITVQPTSNSAIGINGKYLERLGNVDSTAAPFQYLFPTVVDCDSLGVIAEYDFFNFKCFEDDSFALYNPSGEDCEYLLNNVNVLEYNEKSFTCYPNPVNEKLTIETDFNDSYNVTIYNILGRIVGSYKLNGSLNTIDVSYLREGFYIVQLQSKDLSSQIKKIIKRE